MTSQPHEFEISTGDVYQYIDVTAPGRSAPKADPWFDQQVADMESRRRRVPCDEERRLSEHIERSLLEHLGLKEDVDRLLELRRKRFERMIADARSRGSKGGA